MIAPSDSPAPDDSATMANEAAAFAADEKMPLAIRALVDGMLELYQRRPVLNRVMNDRGRLVVSYIALYLHHSDAGLTTNRFKQVCSQAGITSPGRAAAILALMRFAGLVTPETTTERGQRQRLIPSASFRQLQLD